MTTANTAQPEGPSASRQAASLEFRETTKRYPGIGLERELGRRCPAQLRDALSEMLAHDVEHAGVADAGVTVVGVLSIELISHTVAP